MKYRVIALFLISLLMISCGQYGALYMPGHERSKANNPKNPASIQNTIASSNPASTSGLNPNSAPPILPGQSIPQ